MAKVKVFADKQTDKWTDQNLYAPESSITGAYKSSLEFKKRTCYKITSVYLEDS